MRNTKQQGQFRFVIYKKVGDRYYTGVCLDLDIVEEDKDPVILRKSLEEAAQGYLEAVCENKLDNKLLNQSAPEQYWQILKDLENYFRLLHQSSQSRQSSPIQDSQVFTRNVHDLVHA